MKTTIIILASIFIIGLAVNGYIKLKLIYLQRKRNKCDLSTSKGLDEAKYYNEKINQLMNVRIN